MNDRYETAAIKAALGDSAATVPVSSTKSAIGHLLGAAGAVEAVATVLALRDRIAPPTLGYAEPDEDMDLDYVPDGPRALRHRRPRPARDLELVRVRRPQRRAVLRGARLMASLAVVRRRRPALGLRARAGHHHAPHRGALRPGLAARDPHRGRLALRPPPPGQRRRRGRQRDDRRPPRLRLRAGPDLPRRVAGRPPRRVDRARAAARARVRRAGDRARAVRRRAHGRGRRLARGLRRDLPRARRVRAAGSRRSRSSTARARAAAATRPR